MVSQSELEGAMTSLSRTLSRVMLDVFGQSTWWKNQRQTTCKIVYTEGEKACLSPLAFPRWLDSLIGGMLHVVSASIASTGRCVGHRGH